MNVSHEFSTKSFQNVNMSDNFNSDFKVNVLDEINNRIGDLKIEITASNAKEHDRASLVSSLDQYKAQLTLLKSELHEKKMKVMEKNELINTLENTKLHSKELITSKMSDLSAYAHLTGIYFTAITDSHLSGYALNPATAKKKSFKIEITEDKMNCQENIYNELWNAMNSTHD